MHYRGRSLRMGIRCPLYDNISSGERVRIAVFAGCDITLAAHAYGFFNATFINDRIYYFGEPDFDFAKTGKWFMPILVQMHYSSYLPWLIGMLEILFVSFSVYATSEVLRFEKKLSIWIVTGLYVTDASFVRGNFYTGDVFAFALAMAALSAWIWSLKESNSNGRIFLYIRNHFFVRVLISAIPIMISLAVYGAYAPVAVVLILLGAVVLIFRGKEVGYVLKRIVEYVLTYVIGMIAYYVVLRIILKVRDLEMLTYMGENRLVTGATMKELLNYFAMSIKGAVKSWIGMDPASMIPSWCAIILLIFSVFLFIAHVAKYTDIIHDWRKMLVLLLIVVLLPVSAGMIYMMAFGNVNGLMTFTYVLLYVGMVKLEEMTFISVEKKKQIGVVKLIAVLQVILLCFVIGRGIALTNMAYSGLEKSYTASKSIATRLMERIEDCEGAEGTETVVFIGDLSDNYYFKNVDEAWKTKIGFLGLPAYSVSFTYMGNTREFLQKVMGFYRVIDYYNPESDSYAEIDHDLITNMAVFPADGSIIKDEDIIFVRLAPTEY